MTPVLTERHPRANEVRYAVAYGVHLAVACLISYWIATYLLVHLLSVSTGDDLLGRQKVLSWDNIPWVTRQVFQP